jgi:hypothetical protein
MRLKKMEIPQKNNLTNKSAVSKFDSDILLTRFLSELKAHGSPIYFF